MFRRLSQYVAASGSATNTSDMDDTTVADTGSMASSKPRLSFSQAALGRRFAKRMSTAMNLRRLNPISSASGPTIEREPTYRLEPTNRFDCKPIKQAVKDVVDCKLENAVYDSKRCPLWIRSMSDDIKHKVKGLGFDRHKIVVFITLCQRTQQNAVCSSRCQWDPKNDNFVTYTFENQNLVCNVTVYGVYRE